MTLGAAIDRLAVSPLLDWLERTFRAPMWDEWIAPKLAVVAEYGEKHTEQIETAIRSEGFGFASVLPKDVRSHFFERYLWDEYQEACRERSEARFRLNLLLLLGLVGLSVAFDGWLWLTVAVVSWVVFGLELSVRWARVAGDMSKARMGELQDQLDRVEKSLAWAIGRSHGVPPSPPSAKVTFSEEMSEVKYKEGVASVEGAVLEVKAQIKETSGHQFR